MCVSVLAVGFVISGLNNSEKNSKLLLLVTESMLLFN